MLKIRLDIKYLKINLLSSLERAPGRRFGDGGLVRGGVAHGAVAGAVGQPGDTGGGCPRWVPGCLSRRPQLLRLLGDSPARFAAGGSRPACHVSVENCRALLQTCLDPPGIRGVSAGSTRTAWARPGSWGPGRAVPCPAEPRCGAVATPCWPGRAVPGLYPWLGRAAELSVPVVLPGLQPWPGRRGGVDGELGWWKGSGRGFPGAVAAAEQEGTCHRSPGLEMRAHRHFPPRCPLRMPSTRP